VELLLEGVLINKALVDTLYVFIQYSSTFTFVKQIDRDLGQLLSVTFSTTQTPHANQKLTKSNPSTRHFFQNLGGFLCNFPNRSFISLLSVSLTLPIREKKGDADKSFSGD
jgi:hypothetical protein